ncbi:MAG: fructose-bisphosphate aldolase class I [Chloroflexota bacterium]|nr:fructose-bisphosphate aldolase class I [Chloroflexota bacterium]
MSNPLHETAQALADPGRGILAADESLPTIKRRFDSIGLESTETNRRDWRQLLFTSEGIGDWISGVILFEETLTQSSSDGRSLVEVLTSNGVIPGVKVDKGTKDLAGSPDETITEGLDGLRERLEVYREQGARFTKWRAAIAIADGRPTDYCIDVNAHALARFAALSQEAGLVPLVEPEVLMDGEHDIGTCAEATEAALLATYAALAAQNVDLPGTLLKPNMVLSGKSAADRAPAEVVASETLRVFANTVPPAVPGCFFLSGGQSDEEATVNLNAINVAAAGSSSAPWELSFSYGRGLQATPLSVWAGKPENVASAQAAFQERARLTSAARKGEYAG